MLDDCIEHRGSFWMLWPSSRHATAKVRVFIDHMCAGLFLRAASCEAVTFYRQECARQGLVLLHNTALTVFLGIFNVDIILLA